MKYTPGDEKNPLPFSPFKSMTVPRPIGWLSTVSPDGVENLAPYSQWQNLTFDPPMVMFAANQYPDGRRKDTVLNAEQTGWFVWNMATYDLREAVNISAMALPPGERVRPRRPDQGLRRPRSHGADGGRQPLPLRVQVPHHAPPARREHGRHHRRRLRPGLADSRGRRGHHPRGQIDIPASSPSRAWGTTTTPS